MASGMRTPTPPPLPESATVNEGESGSSLPNKSVGVHQSRPEPKEIFKMMKKRSSARRKMLVKQASACGLATGNVTFDLCCLLLLLLQYYT